jgi:hypothetical protein
MMTKDESLAIMREQGKADALDLQSRAASMTGTEIIAEETKVPNFNPKKDYSSWKAGSPVADEGQVWLLIQPYNASHYAGRPSELRALWGLAHTKDPKKAKAWVAPFGISGLYMIDEVCIYQSKKDDLDHIWLNKHDNNEFPPETLNVEDRWEDLGVVGYE